MTDQPNTDILLLRLTALEEKLEKHQQQVTIVEEKVEKHTLFCEKRYQDACVAPTEEGQEKLVNVKGPKEKCAAEMEVEINIHPQEKTCQLTQKLANDTSSKRQMVLKNNEFQNILSGLAKQLTEEQKCNKRLKTVHLKEKSDLEKKYKKLEEKLKKHKELECRIIQNSTNSTAAAAQTVQKTLVNVRKTDASHNITTRIEQLFTFSKDGNVAEVKSIIASGVDVKIVDEAGKTPLHYAAENGHEAICEHLLNKGVYVNVGEDTITPLHLACCEGHLPVVKLLISRGALINICSSDIYTPLHYAAKHGHTAVCEYLLHKGARDNVLDAESVTPLHLACSEGNCSVVKLLISHNPFVRSLDSSKNSILHYAAKHGRVAICQYLLDNQASVYFTNNTHSTPLHEACSNGHLPVVKLLIARGADVGTKDCFGRTPLSCAQAAGHASVCDYLKK